LDHRHLHGRGRGGGDTDHAIIRQWALADPDGFQPLIDLLTTAVTEFLDHQIEAGAEAVQLFESWAGICLSPSSDAGVSSPSP